jgi:hypothetical protein
LAKISGKKGAFIEGTAVGLQNEFVWVFDLDTDNRTYYRDHEHPLDVIDDKWAFNDAPIGSDSDPLGSTTVIVVIRASESCSNKLESARPNSEGDFVFKSLPAGCVVEDKIRVVKARP